MGPLEAGYEANRRRLGLVEHESQDVTKGIGFGLFVSLGGVAIVAVFIYWIGTLSFWHR